MKYMLLIYDDEKGWAKLSETERQQAMGEYMQFTQQIQSGGQYVASSQLHPTSAATSVRLPIPPNAFRSEHNPAQSRAYFFRPLPDFHSEDSRSSTIRAMRFWT